MVSTHVVGVALSMSVVATRLGFMLWPRKVKRSELEADGANPEAARGRRRRRRSKGKRR
ncbi:MAG TPA: hypothetical protein VFK32_04660 [Tepidiformaceae bacterium]|nr:hypothetical protein [Tepidiformaceae bacterium]